MRYISHVGMLALTAFAWVLSFSSAGAVMPNGGWDACWSPDGTQVAYTSCANHDIPNLWVTRVANKPESRQLTLTGAHQPHWLPDGKTIVFSTVRTGTPRFMAIDADGAPGSERLLEYLPANAKNPVWSSNGALVAYATVTTEGTACNLAFTRTSGGGEELTKNFWVREWAWSPDDTQLAFVVGRATGTSLWSVRVKDKSMSLVYQGYCSSPAYSPDGKRLAIAIPDMKSGFRPVIIDLEKNSRTEIPVTAFDGNRLCWSPDGTRLYFGAFRKTEPGVWSVMTTGESLKKLTTNTLVAPNPVLSPSGTRLAYEAMTKDAYTTDLYVCDAAGTIPVQITHSTAAAWAPSWSPDGKLLVFRTDIHHTDELYVATETGQGRRKLADLNAEDAQVCWLPNNNQLLLADGGRLTRLGVTGSVQPQPFSALRTLVRDPAVTRGGIILAELQGTDIFLVALKNNGTERHQLTKRPEPPAPPKTSVPGKTPVPAPGPAGALPGGGLAHYAADVTTVPPTAATAGEASPSGDPHAGLGIMTPHPNLTPSAPRASIHDLTPAVSPDGTHIAFVRQDQVWVVNSDGTGARQLSHLPTPADAKRRMLGPCWLRNGTALLALSFSDQAGTLSLEIWQINLSATPDRRLYAETVASEFGVFYTSCTSSPALTPNGQQLVFTSLATGVPRIMSMPIAGGALRELVPAPAIFPALDCTGRKLAYVDLANAGEQLRVRNLSTGKTYAPFTP